MKANIEIDCTDSNLPMQDTGHCMTKRANILTSHAHPNVVMVLLPLVQICKKLRSKPSCRKAMKIINHYQKSILLTQARLDFFIVCNKILDVFRCSLIG